MIAGKYLLLPTKNVSCTPFNAHQPPPEALHQANVQILDVFVEGIPDYTPKSNEVKWHDCRASTIRHRSPYHYARTRYCRERSPGSQPYLLHQLRKDGVYYEGHVRSR